MLVAAIAHPGSRKFNLRVQEQQRKRETSIRRPSRSQDPSSPTPSRREPHRVSGSPRNVDSVTRVVSDPCQTIAPERSTERWNSTFFSSRGRQT
ncbi:hypothetical protein GN956_G21255 [Arapaima gigas]